MTDHKAEAERLLVFEQAVSQQPAKAALASAAAQVHATLYLAEQQRIANHIAFAQLLTTPGATVDPTIPQEKLDAAGQVMAEGLGLA